MEKQSLDALFESAEQFHRQLFAAPFFDKLAELGVPVRSEEDANVCIALGDQLCETLGEEIYRPSVPQSRLGHLAKKAAEAAGADEPLPERMPVSDHARRFGTTMALSKEGSVMSRVILADWLLAQQQQQQEGAAHA
jgi:hypothetical protein